MDDAKQIRLLALQESEGRLSYEALLLLLQRDCFHDSNHDFSVKKWLFSRLELVTFRL